MNDRAPVKDLPVEARSAAAPADDIPAFASVELWWPAVAALLLTSWTALYGTERGLWMTVGALSGPPALLYAAVERARQRRAAAHGRLDALRWTAPLVLLAVLVAWGAVLLVLTRFQAVFAVLVFGPFLSVAVLALGYAIPIGHRAYRRLIDRRPWVGAALGLLGFGLVAAWTLPFALAYRTLRANGHPRLDCSEVVDAGVASPQWVTLTGGMIPGELRPQTHRHYPASVLLGKVDHTDVALVDKPSGRWIDLRFVGLDDGPSYWGPFKGNLDGLLADSVDHRWGAAVSPALVEKMNTPPVAVLYVGCGPATAGNNLLLSLPLLALLGWLTLHSVRRWRGPTKATDA